jgi:O-antigen ligase
VGVLGYLFYQSSYSGILRERIDRTLQSDDSLISDRVRLAKAGWQAFQESPLLGVGLDNFQYVAKTFDVPMVTAQAPHNLWLQFLAQVGLIGTLSFLVVIVCWFLWLLWAQRVSRSQARRDVLWAFIASMTALMAIFMFVPVMIDRLYWFIYGLGLATVLSVRNGPIIRIADAPAGSRLIHK